MTGREQIRGSDIPSEVASLIHSLQPANILDKIPPGELPVESRKTKRAATEPVSVGRDETP